MSIVAPKDVVEARQALCLAPCERLRQRRPGAIIGTPARSCGACGCVVAWKTMVASEFCPIGKWGPHKEPTA